MSFAAVAAGASVTSSIYQGMAQSEAAKYNSQLALQQAQQAREAGIQAAAVQQKQAARTIGSMRANYGASGVDVGQGSPLDVLADSAANAEMDRMNILWNAESKAIGLENTSRLYKMQAQTAMTSGFLNAIGSGMMSYAMAGRGS